MANKTEFSIGSRVRDLHEELGWSQARLAEMIPGVKQQSIDQLEQGKIARPRFLPELAQVFGISEQWLRTGKGKAALSKLREAKVDLALLGDVMTAVERTLKAHGQELDRSRKAKLIGALYELMLSEERRTAGKLEAAANTIVTYEQVIGRKRG